MTRWTQKQLNEYSKRTGDNRYTNEKKSKYNNKKTIVDGITFDSLKEANYYQELLILQRLGEVTSIELQPKYVLIPSFKKNGKKYRAISYIADFKVTFKNGEVEIIDIKGYETEVFKIKKKLFEYFYPDFALKIL